MEEIDKVLKKLTDNDTPCVQYNIFTRDKILHSYSHGYADILNRKVVDRKTSFHWYSVTKTFTALAVLQLAELKKITLDHAVRQYLPDFPYSSEITVRQLLAHTAGIPNPVPLSWIHLSSEHKAFDRNAFFKNVIEKNKRTRSKPNDMFSYSNLGYVILGQVIENITGMSYEAYVTDNIIAKMGLKQDDLAFNIPDAAHSAKGYHKRMSISNLILGLFIDKAKYFGKTEEKWKPFNSFYVNGSPYGGLVGTSEAFITYLKELLSPDCKLITRDFKKLLFTENLTNNHKPTGMCLSWFTGQLNGVKFFTHAGGGGGFYCEIRIYPDINTGSVIVFNRTGMTDERFLDNIDKYIIKNN
jgi:CubicO group peptidase (beta-lactamase class C family)